MTDTEKIIFLRKTILKESQVAFAERLGITQGAISGVERGKYALGADALGNLFREYGINPNWWFFDEEPPLLKDKPQPEASVPKTEYEQLERQVRQLQEQVIKYQEKELNQRQSQ